MRIVGFILLGLILSCSAPAQADERELILWPVGDFRPYTIITGPDKGQGAADVRIKILINHLPQFRHEIVEAPLSRMVDMLKTKPNICSVTLFKTVEREQFMAFSAKPLLDILPNGFITTSARLASFKPYITREGELNLNHVLASHKYRIGISPDRSFGSAIDTILGMYVRDGSVVFVPTADQLPSRLLKLFYQKEFDATIGYPIELHYVARYLGLREQDFVVLPIAGQAPLISTFASCSKSELGKRVIDAINRLIVDPDVEREINNAYRHFLDEDSAVRLDQLHLYKYRHE